MCNSITKNQGVIHDLFKIGAALAAIILGSVSVALADDLIGQASVIDGDTLEIHGTRIRRVRNIGRQLGRAVDIPGVHPSERDASQLLDGANAHP
jgi:hypothetical protein